MRQTFINTRTDIAWLRAVHLPNLPMDVKAAVIDGNEDCPNYIETYTKEDPDIGDDCIHWSWRAEDGSFVQGYL